MAAAKAARTRTSHTSSCSAPPDTPAEAPADCSLCPRLVLYRGDNVAAEPTWFNGAVPSFGQVTAELLIVGLAPGRGGANRTGRPFTGDYAGDLLYETLIAHGFATGPYGREPTDGLKLSNAMITNAVRCVPPQNKPTPEEISTCRRFFSARLQALPRLRVMLALGRIAHDQILTTCGERKAAHPFAHGARHRLASGVELFDSYHCSRYNTNTGRLTPKMFHDVFADIHAVLKTPKHKG